MCDRDGEWVYKVSGSAGPLSLVACTLCSGDPVFYFTVLPVSQLIACVHTVLF